MTLLKKIGPFAMVALLGATGGIIASQALTPDCNCTCPECPDARLEVQPFSINAEELKTLRRNNITITYSPQYTGNVVVQECDSTER